MNNKKIKDELINACLKLDSKLFLPYLRLNNVKTYFPNERSFYAFFRFRIKCTKMESVGGLRFKIGKNDYEFEGRVMKCYKFYDEVHTYSRLTIYVEDKGGFVYLDIPPF